MDSLASKSLSSLSKYLILYLITLFAEGGYRNYVINSHFINFKYIHLVKLSSNINMVITSLFFVIIIILIICHFTSEIFDLNLSVNSIIQSFISVVLVFTIFQILKLIIDITLLQVPDCDLTVKNSFINSLKKTEWFQYSSITSYLMIFIGTVTFGIKMYIQEKQQNFYGIVIQTNIFFFCHLIVLL